MEGKREVEEVEERGEEGELESGKMVEKREMVR
jgi:hypothetical protein